MTCVGFYIIGRSAQAITVFSCPKELTTTITPRSMTLFSLLFLPEISVLLNSTIDSTWETVDVSPCQHLIHTDMQPEGLSGLCGTPESSSCCLVPTSPYMDLLRYTTNPRPLERLINRTRNESWPSWRSLTFAASTFNTTVYFQLDFLLPSQSPVYLATWSKLLETTE
jgi:hypothetical protein